MQEEWEALRDQWKYSQPEKAEELEEAGEDLDEIAKARLESADAKMDGMAKTIAERLNEGVTDPVKRHQNEQLAAQMAQEMRNEELKYL